VAQAPVMYTQTQGCGAMMTQAFAPMMTQAYAPMMTQAFAPAAAAPAPTYYYTQGAAAPTTANAPAAAAPTPGERYEWRLHKVSGSTDAAGSPKPKTRKTSGVAASPTLNALNDDETTKVRNSIKAALKGDPSLSLSLLIAEGKSALTFDSDLKRIR